MNVGLRGAYTCLGGSCRHCTLKKLVLETYVTGRCTLTTVDRSSLLWQHAGALPAHMAFAEPHMECYSDMVVFRHHISVGITSIRSVHVDGLTARIGWLDVLMTTTWRHSSASWARWCCRYFANRAVVFFFFFFYKCMELDSIAFLLLYTRYRQMIKLER